MSRKISRILGLFLAAPVAAAALPQSAQNAVQAEDLSYALWMGGVQVTSETLSGEGWNFDPDSSTLTLNGYSFDGVGYQGGGTYPECGAIYSEISNLTLIIEGTNTVREAGGVSGHYGSNGIVAMNSLTIKGSGTLNAVGGTSVPMSNGHGQSRGIRVIGTLTIDNDFTGTINSKGSALRNPMNTDVCHGLAADTLIINNGTVNAKAGDNTGGHSYGIIASSAVINGGTVRAEGGNPTDGYSYGFGRATLTINGGSVTLIGKDKAFYNYGFGGTHSIILGNGMELCGSVNEDGSDPEDYQEANIASYKYLSTGPHTHSPHLMLTPAATCTEPSQMPYYHCDGCGKNFEDADAKTEITDIAAWGIIPALGHDYGEWTQTKAPTETEPGEETRICNNDPTHVETREIPVLEPADPVTYEITEGANAERTAGSSDALTLAANADPASLLAVKINGAEVDASAYTAAADSAAITLNAEYLNTLSPGTYTVTLEFTDGEAETQLTILAETDDTAASQTETSATVTTTAAAQPQTDTAPKTGDNSPWILWITLFAAVCAGSVMLTAGRRTRSSEE